MHTGKLYIFNTTEPIFAHKLKHTIYNGNKVFQSQTAFVLDNNELVVLLHESKDIISYFSNETNKIIESKKYIICLNKMQLLAIDFIAYHKDLLEIKINEQ